MATTATPPMATAGILVVSVDREFVDKRAIWPGDKKDRVKKEAEEEDQEVRSN